ncbi:right-handed parallel beta-helix repeat-containing protein [Paenibacillus koleovorans]|uniref:right-handed parallel beta-helix repeat-containing protein n=1 Tax=Paenibacillus koleovorans TaxID=121608 RepID=UPI0013E34730|nr:right-handed parallel beta-helix repeat-containing protein [Paenibacillus koleovorans]
MSEAAAIVLYMSADGDDSWSGEQAEPGASGAASGAGAEGPLRTLEAVQAKLRKLVRQAEGGGCVALSDVTVLVRGGTYLLGSPVIFTREDWPSEEFTLTIEAYPGETPVFSSGVPVGGWRRLETDGAEGVALASLPPEARGHVWVTDVPAELADRKFRTLYKGTASLPRAISPGFRPELEHVNHGENWATDPKDILHFPPGAMRSYANLEDVELLIRPTFQWLINILPLKSVDGEARIARTAIDGTYPLKQLYRQPHQKTTCWVENALDYLDAPGEWVLDSARRKLYLWPPDGEVPGEDIYAASLREFIRIEGDAANETPICGIDLRGLTFTQGDRDVWTAKDAGLQHDWDMFDKDNAMVRLRWAERCKIEQCRFVNSGSSAVRLDLYAQHNLVARNEIVHIGGTGVLLCGYGPGTKDVNRANRVEHNHIHHCGERFWHALGIFVWQSGDNVIARNRIHNTPYSGIAISGVRDMHLAFKQLRECSRTIRWEELGDLPETIRHWEEFVPYLHARRNRVEFNELYAVMEKLGDGNAIYLSGAGDDNVVHGNYIHDVVDCHMQSAIRTDDYQRLTRITGNLICRCCGGGITLKLLNFVENNLIADLLPVEEPDGTLTPPKGYLMLRKRPSAGSTIQRNILYKTALEGDFYLEGRGPDGEWAKNCETDHNLYWCTADRGESDALLERNRMDGIDVNSISADPLFVDAAEGDYRLTSNSPALRAGFVPIEIGAVWLKQEN